MAAWRALTRHLITPRGLSTRTTSSAARLIQRRGLGGGMDPPKKDNEEDISNTTGRDPPKKDNDVNTWRIQRRGLGGEDNKKYDKDEDEEKEPEFAFSSVLLIFPANYMLMKILTEGKIY